MLISFDFEYEILKNPWQLAKPIKASDSHVQVSKAPKVDWFAHFGIRFHPNIVRSYNLKHFKIYFMTSNSNKHNYFFFKILQICGSTFQLNNSKILSFRVQ